MNERRVEIDSMDASEIRYGFDLIREELEAIKEKVATGGNTILLTPNEVCEWLKISKPTLCDWSKKMILKKYKFGNRVYYKKEEIIQSLDTSNYPDN